jgi:hypothetical protein
MNVLQNQQKTETPHSYQSQFFQKFPTHLDSTDNEHCHKIDQIDTFFKKTVSDFSSKQISSLSKCNVDSNMISVN